MDRIIKRSLPEGRQRLARDGITYVPLTRTVGPHVIGNHAGLHVSQKYPDEFARAIALLAVALKNP